MSTGTVPPGWKTVTLDELAASTPNAIVDGPFGSNLKLSDYVPEGVPVLQGTNITDDTFRWFDVRFISERKANELKRSSVRIGDILIVKIGSIGYSAVIDHLNGFDHAIIPANLAKVTPNLGKVELRYLHRWLTSTAAKQYFVRVASKTAQPALSLAKIKGLPVPLPPLPEQRRLAEILDKADTLRAKRRAALAHLDTLNQSIFLDMFGNPVSNPREWPTARFEEICRRVTVGIVVQPASYYVPEGVPALRSLNIRPGKIVLDDLVYFSKSDNDTRLAKTKLKVGDVVLVRSGQPGTAAIVPRELDGVNAIDLLIATPDQSRANPIFLCEFFNSPGGRDLVLSRQRAGAKAPQRGISQSSNPPAPLD